MIKGAQLLIISYSPPSPPSAFILVIVHKYTAEQLLVLDGLYTRPGAKLQFCMFELFLYSQYSVTLAILKASRSKKIISFE